MKSDAVKKGLQQAPHRSLFNALGMTEEEMERPLVGIVCSYNEIVPGHMNLDKIANAVKMGVAMAGKLYDMQEPLLSILFLRLIIRNQHLFLILRRRATLK